MAHDVVVVGAGLAGLTAARDLTARGFDVVVLEGASAPLIRGLGAEMGEALGAADEVVVLDVYAARETPDPAVTGALVADSVPLPAPQVRFVPRRDDALTALTALVVPGDLVLTLGAGDVTALAPALLEALRRTPPVAVHDG